jgi:hypothetical protein
MKSFLDRYVYDGGPGVDFDANLKLPSIDFGTFHLYPEGWGNVLLVKKKPCIH